MEGTLEGMSMRRNLQIAYAAAKTKIGNQNAIVPIDSGTESSDLNPNTIR